MTRRPGVLVLPRDPNPYQERLYEPIRRRGWRVHYAACPTGSQTLNLLLLPLEFLCCRIVGYRVLHIHWVFGFRFPGSHRAPILKRVARLWFTAVLAWARLIDFGVVWTAHNVLPHSSVFDDDRRGRETLVGFADVVIAHSPAAAAGLAAIGLRPSRLVQMPMGPDADLVVADLAPAPESNPRTALFFGRIVDYKGVEDLLTAVAQVAELRVEIVGACADPQLRTSIERLAAATPGRVQLELSYLPDAALRQRLTEAHACVFPFRRVTTSSSVLQAMSAGRLVIVPDLDAFSDLVSDGVVTYPPGIDGLRETLAALEAMPADELQRRGTAAKRYATSFDWESIADRTIAAFGEAASAGRPR